MWRLNFRKIDLSEYGRKLIAASFIVRSIEKLHARWEVYQWLPEIEVSWRNSLSLPNEFWSMPLTWAAYSVGIMLGFACFFPGKYRWMGFLALYLHGVVFSWGGHLIAGGALFMQPAALLLAIEGFLLEKKFKFSLPFYLVIFLGLMYGINGVRKDGIEWQSGHAFSLFLTSNISLIEHSFNPDNMLMKLITWFTRYWEILGFSLLIPLGLAKEQRIRVLYSYLAIPFHLILLFITTLKAFSIALIGAWMIVMKSEFSYRETLQAMGRWQRAFLMLWMVATLWPNAGVISQSLLPPVGYVRTAIRLQLFPYWSLFGPRPEFGKLAGSIQLPSGKTLSANGSRAKLSLVGSLISEKAYWRALVRVICSRGPGEIVVLSETEKWGRNERRHHCASPTR